MIDITIRHGDAHDVDAIRTISAQPAVCKNTPQHPFPSFEKWQQRLERIREQGVSLVAEVDGAVVGYLAPHTEPNPRRRHAAGLGMMIDASHHGAASAAVCSRPRSTLPRIGSTSRISS
ncbi:N-acetyltransferase GCN5 [Burkholderia multivorans]|nr:N-acetyltransferase GCN5 [Burkholderia multivorans]SAJ87107.1 N-acetyltransferase GCN5 [Burkholderia multivorans]